MEEDQIVKASLYFFNKKFLPNELRYYQIQALQNWQKNDFQGTIQIFCGLGKSLISLFSVLFQFFFLNKNIVLVCFFQLNLLEQYYDNFAEFLQRAGIAIKIIDSRFRKNFVLLKNQKLLFLSTYDSAFKLKQYKIDYVILDECQHSLSRTRSHVRNIQSLKLSATPDAIEKDIIYNYSISKAIQKGFLCDFELIIVPREKEQDEDFRYLNYFTRIVKLMKSRGKKRAISYSRLVKVKNDKNTNMNEFQKYKIDGAQFLFVNSNISVEQRKKVFQEFQDMESGEEIKIIFNSQLILEGIDLPCADVVIFNDNSQTESKIVQIIGRLMRPFPGKQKGLVVLPSNEILTQQQEESLQENDFSVFETQFNFSRNIILNLLRYPDLFQFSKFQGIYFDKINISEKPLFQSFQKYFFQNNKSLKIFYQRQHVLWQYIRQYQLFPEQRDQIFVFEQKNHFICQYYNYFLRIVRNEENLKEIAEIFLRDCQQIVQITNKELRNLYLIQQFFKVENEINHNKKDPKRLFFQRRKVLYNLKNNLDIFTKNSVKNKFIEMMKENRVFQCFTQIEFLVNKKSIEESDLVQLYQIMETIQENEKECQRIKKKILSTKLFQDTIIFIIKNFSLTKKKEEDIHAIFFNWTEIKKIRTDIFN